MNNKGFAITGIIYTLLILFLMILLTVITGLNYSQKLMHNSSKTFATSFKGKRIEKSELLTINSTGIAPYTGKYIFKITNTSGKTFNNCSTYLAEGTTINTTKITLSPSECNNNISQMELTEGYSFEKES